MADKDFLDYDLLIASGMSPPVANALLTMWERTGAARDVSQALDEIQVAQWGGIQGDISAQTDLQAALDAIEPADGETFLDLGGQAGTRNLDYEAADVQAITVTGNLTLGVDNWPVPGELGELRVILYDADQHTVSLPGTWAEGVTPTFSSHDRIALYSEDGGNTIYKVRYFQASERTIKWGNLTGTLSDQTDLQSALDAKDGWDDAVDADIVPDADGTRDLGADATRFANVYADAGDIAGNLSVGGTVDGRDVSADGTKLDGIEAGATAGDDNAFHDDESGEIAALTGKSTPVDADVTLIEDSAASNAKKSLSWANIKATLKTYFDALYAAVADAETITGAWSWQQYLDMEDISEPSDPAANRTRLWAEAEQGFSSLHMKDSGGIDVEISRDSFHVCWNGSGVAISQGDVVYLTGGQGNVPTIALANASDASKMPAFGVAAEDIPDSSFGRVSTRGDVQGFDLSTFIQGDIVYVSATTPGAITATKPQNDEVQRIGEVTKATASGILTVYVGTAVERLDDIGNVVLTSIASGEVLTWNGTDLVNETLAEAGISEIGHTHAASDITSGTFADARIAASNVTQHQAALSITESQISDLDHDDADAIHDNVAGEIAAVTEKTAIVGTDLLLIEDSEASNAKKRVQASNLPAGSVAWANITGQEVDAAQSVKYHGKVFSGTETANLSDGLVHKIKAAGDFTFALSGWPTAGKHETAEILAAGWGSHTVTLPDALDWGTAGAPTFSSAAVDRVLLSSDANGNPVHARLDGQGFEAYTRLIAAGVIQSGTLTRNSTANYWNSSGVLTSAATDTARTDYDPSDNSLRGLLIEESRTNEHTQSEALDHADWGTINLNVTADAGAAPDGATTADKAIPDTSSGQHILLQGASSAAGGTDYVASVFAKASGYDFLEVSFRMTGGSTFDGGVSFNISTGAVGAIRGFPDDYGIDDVGGGWFRCWLKKQSPSGTTNVSVRYRPEESDGVISFTGDGTSGALLWGAQTEKDAASPSSYIPTTTTTVTRSDDTATSTVGTWPVPVSIEIIATPSDNQDGVLYQADDGTENNRVRFERISGSLHIIVTNGGTEQANIDLGALTDFTEFTVRAAFDTNDVAASLNGAAVVTDSSATIPTGLTTNRYGKDTAGEHWNAWIRDADEHPRRAPNAELTA